MIWDHFPFVSGRHSEEIHQSRYAYNEKESRGCPRDFRSELTVGDYIG